MQFVLPVMIATVLGALALAFVLYPFYVGRDKSRATTGDHGRSGAGRDKSRATTRDRPYLGRSGAGRDKSGPYAPWTGEGEQGHANGRDSEQAAQEAMLSESEQAARSALYEIELDFQLGNISESDYRTMRERYLQRALVALKSRYDREQELDDAIEAQLQKMKDQNDSVE
jgi:hypothetical protein